MKICPKCQTRFDGNEAFCPNDGGKLVEAKELSPGALTGTTIGKTVKLERLTWSDAFGERYAGRMLDGKAAVHVTVVNPGVSFADDAAKRIEATRAQVGSPLPPQLNTLLKTNLGHLPSYVIHTAPRGPSLRELLDERQSLDWETAARITCRAARASEWLLSQGIVHWALHPGSIYISHLADGAVQLGEWYFDSLMGNRAPETRISANEPFAGYLGVMAPEIAQGGDADERSVVFALGALFFELVTGKAPFAAGTPSATLERLKAESALKLSIAAGAEGVHPELDDIISLMLARDPEKRLQQPGAAVAVLSNILGTSPDEVAPTVERGDEAFDELYATTELSSFDRDDVPEVTSKQTLLMAGPPNLEAKIEEAEAKDSTESQGISGSSATNDADEASDAVAPGAPVIEDVSDTAAMSTESKKTLMLGSIGDAIQEAESAANAASASISGESTTLAAEPSDVIEPSVVPESEIETRELDRDEKPQEEPQPAVDNGDEKPPSETSVEVDDPIDPEDTQKLDLASSERDREPDDEDNEKNEPVAASPGLNIGFVEAPQAAGSADDWFSGTTEEAWERTLAEEHAQESEKRWKLVLGIALAAVVFAGLSLIVYSQFIWEPAPSEEEAIAEEVEEDAPDETSENEAEVDVERLADRFDRALDAGRVSSPPGNSAHSALKDMLEFAPEDEKTLTAKAEFVTAAIEAADRADAEGDLRSARLFLEHAVTIAPEDSDLRARYDRVDQKYRGTIGSLDGSGAADDAGVPDTGTNVATNTVGSQKPKPIVNVEPKPTPKPTPKPAPQPTAKKPKGDTINDVLKKARQAYSRDDSRTAESLYKQALDMNSSNHTANSGLGQVYFDQGAYARAVRYQMQAVRGRPNSVEYRINLGQSYYRLGKYSDAIRSWEAALARDPNNSNAKKYIELAQKKLN